MNAAQLVPICIACFFIGGIVDAVLPPSEHSTTVWGAGLFLTLVILAIASLDVSVGLR